MKAARRKRVAVAGFGTVGRSVARLVQRLPEEFELTAILNRQPERKRVDWIDGPACWTDSFEEVMSLGPDVFVELIGGRTPATDWIRRALSAGISVVTANKQVIAHDGVTLLDTAARAGCHLRFEAAVAGGVPIINAIETGVAADDLVRVAGILNGTCNYILTLMEQDGAAFTDALQDAQAKGFAEADPSQDVDGLDSRAKLAVLALVALGVRAHPDGIPTRSIRPVEGVDFAYARRLGCTIRQVAWAERSGKSGLRGGVGPALVPFDSPLAAVNGSENLVTIEGRFGGATTYRGRGAGGDPTAVAVVSDLLAIARGAPPAVRRELVTVPAVASDAATPHYIRLVVADRPGIVAALAAVLARHGINIDAILQEPGYPVSQRPFVVTIEAAPAPSIESALDEIRACDFHLTPLLAMPILASPGPAAGSGT